MEKEEKLQMYRHSMAHILAMAIKELYPTTLLGMGPAIDNGFYYDFDCIDDEFGNDDIQKIEAKMTELIKLNLDIKQENISVEKAKDIFSDEKYKLEIINDKADSEVTVYYFGEFADICKGPHIENTRQLGNMAFKIDRISGAYWKGSEKNKMLKRVYCLAFTDKKQLNNFINEREIMLANDHNKLGRTLGIFTTNEAVGQGLPLLMPKGAKLLSILSRFIEDEQENRGYQLTYTPTFAKNDLYKISGHWDHYKDSMFVIGDEKNDKEVFALRPMTCPFQFMIYKNDLHSYRELPIRFAETARLARKESSGEMHGLIRVREFTLSDSHIVCTPEQLNSEFKNVFDLINYVIDCIGLDDRISFRFSKWDSNNTDKYVGSVKEWEDSQAAMKQILDEIGIEYVEAEGEAAFYGPKLDIQTKNVHGKEDTIITIQIDFALAERFDMTYIDNEGNKKRPIIIHHSVIGCYERTIAMLIEKYAGKFPVWMCPVQVKLLPISESHFDYVNKISNELKAQGIRVSVDYRNEKIGLKIREASNERIPYMLIIGDKEVEENSISYRFRGENQPTVDKDEFINIIKNQILIKK